MIKNKMVIWGTGKRGKEFFMQCKRDSVLCFVDSRPMNDELFGKPIIMPCDLCNIEYGVIVVTPENNAEIRSLMSHLKLPEDKIVFLFIYNFEDWLKWDASFELLLPFVGERWVEDLKRRQGLLDRTVHLSDINTSFIYDELESTSLVMHGHDWEVHFKNGSSFTGKRKECVRKIYEYICLS